MRVSVIIPCFNEENYIGKCLESLTRQSRMPDEVVVCDNNSTDNSIKIISKFSTKLPLVIVHEAKKGIIPALQKAYSASTGDYILRTDSDTILPKNWVKNIVINFEAHPEIDVIGGYIYSSEKIILGKVISRLVHLIYDCYFRLFQNTILLIGCNTAFKRPAIAKISGYDPFDCTAPEDIMMAYKMRDAGLKTRRFKNCHNFASLRRIKQDPREIIYIVLGMSGNPKYYHEKSV